MGQRITERFNVGDLVEVFFPQLDAWVAGEVVAHQPPAIWVRTSDGRPWFVTNGRRVRPRAEETARAG